MLIDFFIGALLGLGVAHFFDLPFSPWWLVLGMLFAVLPDIDFWIELVKRKTVGGTKLGDHRVLTHMPLLFVLPGIGLYLWAGAPVATLFALGLTWHFLHDANGMGYGYRLLWPFSQKFYKFFSDKDGNYCYDRRHFCVSWTRAEVEALHKKHGNDHWIQDHLRHHATRWHRPVVTILMACVILYCILFLVSLFLPYSL